MERWKINIIVIWFTQVISLMSISMGLPFLPYYIQEMGVTDPAAIKTYTALIGLAPTIGMGLMAPLWGMLADRWGKKLMLLRAVFFATLILFFMSLATEVWHIIFLRLCQGLFTGTVTAAATFAASNTPDKKLSSVLGFLSSSTFIGISLGPAIGGIVADSLGYNTSFLIGSSVMLLDFLLVLFIVKEVKLQKSEIKKDNDKRFGLFKSMKSLLSFTMICMLLMYLFIRMSRSVFPPFISLFVQDMRGTIVGSSRTTGYISGISALATAVSAVSIGWLGTRFNKQKLLMLCIVSAIIMSIPLIFMPNLLLFTILYVLFMFAIGGMEPILITLTSEVTPVEKRGLLFGVQSSIGNIGRGTAPIIAGLVSIGYSVSATLLLIPICLSIVMLAAIILYKNTNQKVSEKRLV